MAPSRIFVIFFEIIVAFVADAIQGRAASPDESRLPRYQLKVGQELSYRHTSLFKYGKGEDEGILDRQFDWQAWVLRHNEDRSWRIVLQWNMKSTFCHPKEKRPEPIVATSLGHCDLFPDGRLIPSESLGYVMNPWTIFPRLPEDAASLEKGWQDFHARDVERWHYLLQKSPEDSSLIIFEGRREGALDKINLSSSTSQFFFDTKQGFLKRATTHTKQGYGLDGKGTGSIELLSNKEHPHSWVKQMLEESDRYFTAYKDYDELMSQASKDSKKAQTLLARAEKILKDVRGDLHLSLLTKQLDQQIKQHRSLAQQAAAEARIRRELVGKAAPAWEISDLNGKIHSLEAYRGKIVILDFWCRGCGWCIRGMPQIQQISKDFQNDSVVVLGMNTDSDEKDAQFVIEKMNIDYPVLKAQGLSERYKVLALPMLFIIDRQGNLHDLYVGYSQTLRKDVNKVIKDLLREK